MGTRFLESGVENFPEITMAGVLRQSMFTMTGSKKQIRVFSLTVLS